MIMQTYYISTGAKNAMFTLRCHRTDSGGLLGPYSPDFYVCNLSTDEENAGYKASLYFAAMRDRMGADREDFSMHLDTAAGGIRHRRGKLSARDTAALEKIESGVVPFGKHADVLLSECPAPYLLWLSDNAGTFDGIAMNALAHAAAGVALELGHIAARQEKRELRAAVDAASGHIGTVGERIVFEGQVITSFEKRIYSFPSGMDYWINKVLCGNNMVTYIGSKSLGAVGAVVKFKATIKKHDDYKGVLSTQVSRPSIQE